MFKINPLDIGILSPNNKTRLPQKDDEGVPGANPNLSSEVLSHRPPALLVKRRQERRRSLSAHKP